MSDLNDFMECAEWHCSRGLGWQDSKLTHNDVYAIITLLREAEKDAARYRWLRESASLENHGGFEYDLPLIHAVRYMDGAELNQEMTFDEAIDQAMKEKGDE